jgi:plasmid maintenance system antidote protein VapI
MKTGRIRNGRLLAAMAAAGLDGVGLAARTGLSPVTISALVCRRRDPKDDTAHRIAEVLGTTPVALWPGLEKDGGL